MFVLQIQFRRGKPGDRTAEPEGRTAAPEPQPAAPRSGRGALTLEDLTPSRVRASLDSWMDEQRSSGQVRALVDRMVAFYFADDNAPDLVRARQAEAARFYSDPANARVAVLAEGAIGDWAAKLLPPRDAVDGLRYHQYDSTMDFLRLCHDYRAVYMSGSAREEEAAVHEMAVRAFQKAGAAADGYGLERTEKDLQALLLQGERTAVRAPSPVMHYLRKELRFFVAQGPWEPAETDATPVLTPLAPCGSARMEAREPDRKKTGRTSIVGSRRGAGEETGEHSSASPPLEARRGPGAGSGRSRPTVAVDTTLAKGLRREARDSTRQAVMVQDSVKKAAKKLENPTSVELVPP